jgi:hypothetical protein
LVEAGYTTSYREEKNEQEINLPPLDAYVPSMVEGFSSYLTDFLP